MSRTGWLIAAMCSLSGYGLRWPCVARSEPRHGGAVAPILVAAADLRPGTIVTMEMLAQQSVPERFLTEDMVRPDDAHLLLGQVVTRSVPVGACLTFAAVGGIGVDIARGMLAVSVGVPHAEAVGTSDRVDLLGQDGARIVSESKVLAKSRLANGETRLWLEVTGEQAAQLAAGRPFLLALRSRWQ